MRGDNPWERCTDMIKKEEPDTYDLLGAYCKVKGKWAVCVWLGYEDLDTPESFEARVKGDLPLWNEYWDSIADVAMTAINVGIVVFLADTEEEMMSVYHKVRGDDGLPGDPIVGSIYACTYDPEGNMLTENT